MKGRVILCRHGATAWNSKGDRDVSQDRQDKIRGWIDVPLDAEGRQEAVRLAEELKGYDVEEIRTSPLKRATETAKAIAGKHPGITPTLDPALKPWNVGHFAGKPTKEVLPKMEALERMEDRPAPGGEAFREFRERFLKCLIGLLDEAQRDGKTVIAVAHTRNAQITKAWLAAGARRDMKVDDKVMDDYSSEVGTGGTLVLEV